MTDAMFEQYVPASVPAMSEEHAREAAKDIVVSLIQAVFEGIDPWELVEKSEIAAYINADEQERIALLINQARVEIEVGWVA